MLHVSGKNISCCACCDASVKSTNYTKASVLSVTGTSGKSSSMATKKGLLWVLFHVLVLMSFILKFSYSSCLVHASLVALPLVPLFIVSCSHWLLSCHVIISSVCSLVGSCHVSCLVYYK